MKYISYLLVREIFIGECFFPREQNAHLVPIMLNRLHRLQEKAALERQQQAYTTSARPFAHLNHENSPAKKNQSKLNLRINLFFKIFSLQINFFLDNRNSSSGNLGSPRMTSPPPLMSPPPADFHFHEKTPVKLNGVLSKPKGKDSCNGESEKLFIS